MHHGSSLGREDGDGCQSKPFLSFCFSWLSENMNFAAVSYF